MHIVYSQIILQGLFNTKTKCRTPMPNFLLGVAIYNYFSCNCFGIDFHITCGLITELRVFPLPTNLYVILNKSIFSVYIINTVFTLLFCGGRGRAVGHVRSQFPDQGLNPRPATVEAQSPNHWTPREVSRVYYSK